MTRLLAICAFLFGQVLYAMTINPNLHPPDEVLQIPTRNLNVIPLSQMPSRDLGRFSAHLASLDARISPLDKKISYSNFNFNFRNWELRGQSNPGLIAEHFFNNDSIPPELINNFPFLDVATQDLQKQAGEFLNEVTGQSGGLGRMMSKLAGLEKVKFPVGIRDTIADGIVVVIAIEGITFTDRFATLRNLFMSISYSRYPNMSPLVFGAAEITYSRTGGFRQAKVGLIGDFAIPLNENNKMLLILKGYDPITRRGSVATFGCDGYESIQLSSTLYLSRNLVEPVTPIGEPLDGYVHADLDGYFETLDDWSGSVSFQQNFKIPGIDQVVFSLRDAIFDATESHTDSRAAFPTNYFADSKGENPAMWEGLFVREIGFSLDKFADIKGANEQDLGGNIQNLIIDKAGVTGRFSLGNRANPIIGLDRGRIGNSRISVDHIDVAIYKNQPTDLSAKGRVALASLDDGSEGAGLLYEVMVAENGWQFVAGLNEGNSIPFPLLKGAVLIDPGTTLKIAHSEETNRTEIQVNLCGTVDLGEIWPAPDASKDRNITFTNFELQSAKPTVRKVGYWEIPGSISMNLGPVEMLIEDIDAGQTPQDEVILSFSANASFSGISGSDISGVAGLQIYGREDPEQGDRLVYHRTEVNKIGLCIATDSWGAAVELNWFEKDSIYGDGFLGRAALGLKCMGYRQQDDCWVNAGIYARALFGRKDTSRYFNFELLYVDLEKGLELGALAIHALGGSVSNNMARVGMEEVAFDQVNYSDTAEVIAAEKATEAGFSNPSIGKSLLGITYTPDISAGFSIRLMTIAALRGKSSTANMRADLVFGFNANNGLDSIRFDVQGQMFAEVQLSSSEFANPPVAFKAEALYDNNNKIFDLSAELALNIGNPPSIFGGGKLRIHAQANKGWYIHVGYPGEDNNIGLSIPLVDAKTNTYFCAGNTNVPDMPLLPAPIRKMFSATSTQRQFDTGDDLGGLAFGTHLSLGNPEEKNFFIFYYKLHVLLGFDINLRNYKDYLCSGYSEFGIRKWYAKGQAYAYIHGAIGLQSGVKKFPILDLEAGFKIYLESPRPSYGEFGIAVKYKVLGGLIRGRAKIEASFGEKCYMDRGSIDVSIFDEVIAPVNDQALNVAQDITFSSGVQFEQSFPDDMGQQKLRVQLKDNIAKDFTNSSSVGSSIWADKEYVDFNNDQIDDNIMERIPAGWYAYQESLKDQKDFFEKPPTPTNWSKTGFAFYKEDGVTKTIACDKVYTEDNTFVTYIPQETWPPNTEIWIQPQAHFQQSPATANQWKPVSDALGNTFQDTLYRFRTGSYPEEVPQYNIDWTYPVNGMSNYYRRQISKGGAFVGIIKLRKDMSPLLNTLNIQAQVTCHDVSSASFHSECTYDPTNKLISWPMPPEQIKNEALYTIAFIANGKKVLDPIHFRSSKYDELEQKLLRINEQIREIELVGTSRIFIPMDEELFDEVELRGRGVLPPLLSYTYDLQTLRDQVPFIHDHISDQSLDLDKNFFMQTYLKSYDAFQEIPTVEVTIPDQIGEKPTFVTTESLKQFLVSNVHLAFIRAKADLALPEPHFNEERLSDVLYASDVDDWLGTWQHPPTMKIDWTYSLGDFMQKISVEHVVKQQQE
ncbi:MAG: hypothetical protein HKN87_18775 [Saprospiraceae bacterium]|nr:hypothetical protein [Saprospiraceae bacterium]